MKEIHLTQGKVALVDDADYDWLSQWKWCTYKPQTGGFYAKRKEARRDILMHRQILGLERGDKREGDHKNHNTLDNRQDNIRICSCQQNQRNRKPRLNLSSKYKGVSWYERCRKWQAHIQMNGKRKHLGYFKVEKEAALAYDEAARNLFGKFAYLNLT